jgi:peptidyl-tRNA hydrolase, PTH1 family
MTIKAIIGLGNPGAKFASTRHNVGFMIVDALIDKVGGVWSKRDHREFSNVDINGKAYEIIKPQTFMNSSGAVIPHLKKDGISCEEILVIHDELELSFGEIRFKTGGSAKGHNGLKSIIAACGENFHRLRFGIGRPENRDEVPDYVLAPFFKEQQKELPFLLEKVVDEILKKL